MQLHYEYLSPLSRGTVRRFKDRSKTHQDEWRGRFKELDPGGKYRAAVRRNAIRESRLKFAAGIFQRINGETEDRGSDCRIWNAREWLSHSHVRRQSSRSADVQMILIFYRAVISRKRVIIKVLDFRTPNVQYPCFTLEWKRNFRKLSETETFENNLFAYYYPDINGRNFAQVYKES